MTDNGAACPSCRMDALLCIGKEMRTGGPCCADCRMQLVQRPLHVWPRAEAAR